jgi:Cd2+/Zn2+-exporting ATPase
MDCPDCALKLESGISKLRGVDSVKVDYISGKMTAEGEGISEDDIVSEVSSHGYKAVKYRDSFKEKEEIDRKARRKQLFEVIIASLLVISGGIITKVSDTVHIGHIFILAGTLTGGRHIVKKGIFALLKLRLDMNFLMSAAVIGAIFIGEWLEGGVVIILFAIAQLLESYSLARSNRAIKALMDLSPKKATVKRNGQEMVINVEEISIGDIVLVKPGEQIPVDGRISSGFSSVNQANITGESIPVSRVSGDQVYAGTINGDGYLEVETVKNPEDSKLNKIIKLVEEARSKRAPSQSFVEKFSAIYTPIVTILAVLVAIVPPLLLGAYWIEWIYRALTLLVIACPCALVISTPVTVVSALTNAARNGVLIKGGIFIENLHKIESAAFDKTGTVTSGVLSVVKIVDLDGTGEDEILRLAASIEKMSQHPVGNAIVRSAEENGISLKTAEDFHSIPGKGAIGKIDGKEILVGNQALFDGAGTSLNSEMSEKMEGISDTAVLIGTKERVSGIITISDSIRPESKSALISLKKVGIKNSVLITGDNRHTAAKVGGEIGIDEIKAELMPEEKVKVIEELRTQHKTVTMIGDGVNDAPALAAADIGIAMGAIGSDVALETADIALMSDDLSRIPWAFRLSKKAYSIIVANITMAIAIKAIFIGLASAGLATLWMAVFADMGVSLMVIVNGMRALKQN